MTCDWGNVSLFLALAVGHAAFVIAVTNRLHALPLPIALLHRVRQLHDVVIVALPAIFAWCYGWRGVGLLLGTGSWNQLPILLNGYLAVCLASAIAIPCIALYRKLKTCRQLLSSRSQVRDLSAELGFRPIGPGPYRFFTALPGNEILKLEVCEKELQVPELPAEWDGMTILHVSDLHYIGTVDLPYFERLAEVAKSLTADLVVFSGDLLDREDLVAWIPTTLGKLSAPLGCYFVLGNHDSYLTNVPQIRHSLVRCGWIDAAEKTHAVNYRGRELVICGSERPWMGTEPDLGSVSADAFRLFVSHTPDNLSWARRHGVGLMLAGHNHGGQIRLPLFGPVYSPSLYGARYAAGTFWEPPTVMHVSRGISGRHPLRWNCLPELTRLTLRAESR